MENTDIAVGTYATFRCPKLSAVYQFKVQTKPIPITLRFYIICISITCSYSILTRRVRSDDTIHNYILYFVYFYFYFYNLFVQRILFKHGI